MGEPAPAAAAWPRALFDVLGAAGVAQVAYVPDAGHRELIELCQADGAKRCIALTTEEEGVALLAGAWLGGERGVLLLQSSGVGNCVNMLAIAEECRFPLLMLVTMRGEWGEFNPWQVPMARRMAPVLESAAVTVHRVDEPARVAETAAAAARLAYEGASAVAVLIGQRVIGYKAWE